jgi:integrase
MDAAGARRKAEEWLRQAQNGEDPAAQRQAEVTAHREAVTFDSLCSRFIAQHQHLRTVRQYEHALQCARGVWRDRQARHITRDDVRDVVNVIKHTGGREGRGAKCQADHVLGAIKRVFNWAISEGEPGIATNPTAGLKRYKPAPRTKVLADDEIRAVWAALEGEDLLVRSLFRIAMLTGQRIGEVMRMTWTNVDLARGWWTIPAAHAKNNNPHPVPLTPEAAAILRALHAAQEQERSDIRASGDELVPSHDSPFVFQSPRTSEAKPVQFPQQMVTRIRNASGVAFRVHDLRRTAATLMARARVNDCYISKVLNHHKRGVTEVHYIHHDYAEEKREAIAALGREVRRVLENHAADVVPFRHSA